MQNGSSSSEKPVSEIWRPDLIRLPDLHAGRRLARFALRCLCWLLARIFTRIQVTGKQNFPGHGAALLVFNHLGDADALILLACLPRTMDGLGKIELRSITVLGWIMEAYGVIWVHRGRADRRAVQAALDGFAEGRVVGIAPEGRESLTGALEKGTDGAAFLALKGNVPVVPITLTGTENARLLGNLRRWKRTPVTLTIGEPFRLKILPDRRQSLEQGTRQIMETLAGQLPSGYRGEYAYVAGNQSMGGVDLHQEKRV